MENENIERKLEKGLNCLDIIIYVSRKDAEEQSRFVFVQRAGGISRRVGAKFKLRNYHLNNIVALRGYCKVRLLYQRREFVLHA
jgi:hypothetical protein